MAYLTKHNRSFNLKNKIKLSLCLTNQALDNEDLCVRSDNYRSFDLNFAIYTHTTWQSILDPGTSCKYSFTPKPFRQGEKSSGTLWTGECLNRVCGLVV